MLSSFNHLICDTYETSNTVTLEGIEVIQLDFTMSLLSGNSEYRDRNDMNFTKPGAKQNDP